jgi:putative transposase
MTLTLAKFLQNNQFQALPALPILPVCQWLVQSLRQSLKTHLAKVLRQLLHWLGSSADPAHFTRRRAKSQYAAQASVPRHPHAKPPWIRQRILSLKALLPSGTGVRKIAHSFNRQHAAKGHTVSKTYVANTIAANLYAIHQLKATRKAHAPKAGKLNHTWGLDFTGKQDSAGALHSILGIIDHGSRKLLALCVSSKDAITVGHHIHQAAQIHGAPKRIRTDNERCLNAPAFNLAVNALGAQHQRSQQHCPWQNGRIERLFGTLKQQLRQLQFTGATQLQTWLNNFVTWYNTIRPHQHLNGRTPQEVWQGIDYEKDRPKLVTWWSAENGQLSGVKLRW